MPKRLREAHGANSGVAGVTIPALTPREKRILITHTIGELHNRITKLDAYERANVATGALMPVSHCLGEDGPSNIPEDSQVLIQHMKYDYTK